MTKVKVINSKLDENLNGVNFNDNPSQTIFSFGNFVVTTNFDGKRNINYSNKLSTFVQPITLDTIGISDSQSEILSNKSITVIPNLDNSDLKTFVRFGSSYEFLRVSIENIIVQYPASLYINSQINNTNNITFSGLSYNAITNIATFMIPISSINNAFGLIIDRGNNTLPDNITLRNLNTSYNQYVVWSTLDPESNGTKIIGFTGFTSNNTNIIIETSGHPFPNTVSSSGSFDFHIKPNNYNFEEFRETLTQYEKYVVSTRDGISGFRFKIRDPKLLNDGTISYSELNLLWPTGDQYNIDTNTSLYRSFLESLLVIGAKYDEIKTNLISRFLTPESIKTYDLTEDGKINKLLKTFGWEFDRLREFIDSLTYINKITYDKINNVPDQLIKNLSKTFGWDYFSLLNENELVQSFLTIDDAERDLNDTLLPPEIDIELWRRILNNTNYFWKSKGTREAIKSLFLLIGIPEPFISITEYVYTIENKIDPRTVTLLQSDFPSNSLPYDNSGYPVAPLETNDFYFQISGDSDSGQAYMDIFRSVGFNLRRTVDNKKSWIQTGATTRIHNITPQYYQEDSKLVLNTKEVDISLDVARGIEYDVYRYIKEQDYPANSSGYTLPYTYINISLGYTGIVNTFTLPTQHGQSEGDLEVRYNGILLNSPKEYDGVSINDELIEADYIISGNSFTLTNSNYAINSGNRRDVIEATYVYSGGTQAISGVTIRYVVTRVKPNIVGTTIPLPSAPNGDVQVTINGIALTKGTNQFIADYVVDPNNNSQIIIQNPEIISYLATNPYIQLAYITVTGSTSIAARIEITRVDSFSTGKIYYSESANKYVYRLNYKVNNANEVKIMVNGIALEPLTDYTINNNNPFEVYLPKGIKFGSVISAYYLVSGNDYFDPIVSNDFGIGDISKLSFLEFIELIQKRMINSTNRKIVSDYKGGWYPALLNIYVNYLKRSELSSSNPLKSNGYTFANLYPFLNKYNSFFQKFIDQTLSATIILRRSGLLVRNSMFSRQKFTYKRGVNFDKAVNYFGDDGSLFKKRPLSQDVNWTDDYVCTDNLCINFVVTDVMVSYPTTTTTTTVAPYGGIITLDEAITQESISTATNSGKYRRSELNVVFNPEIPPNYTIELNLNYIITQSVTGSTINDQSIGMITIMKNSSNIYHDTYLNIGTLTNDYVVTMINGDTLSIILENTALIGSGGILIISETNLIPTVLSVTPNEGYFTIIPSEINNIISST